jgi:predicted enzyme related to lactoylglutathione lyase
MSEGTTYLHGQFCWHECGTKDQEAAKAFYSGLFGWTTLDKPMPGDMGTYTLFQVDGKDVAGLYTLAGPMFEHVPPYWGCYVNVESVDAVCEELQKHGGETMGPPMDVPDVGRMAWSKDPQGAHVAFFQPGEHCGAAHAGNAIGAWCWDELMTTDAEAAKAYYASILPWKPVDEAIGPIQYTTWMLGEMPAGGMMQMGPEFGEIPPNWLPYVSVEDCDATCAKTQELGGRVCNEPMDIPTVGRFAVLADPQGAVFAVIKLAG